MEDNTAILHEFKIEQTTEQTTEIELNDSRLPSKKEIKLKKVEQFWTPVRIEKINSVELVNQKYYEDEKIVTIPSMIPRKTQKTINQRGLLESADLKVVMTLPKIYLTTLTFDEFISSLSYRVSNEYLPTNFNLTIQIISNATLPNPENYYNGSELTDYEEDDLLFSIEVPLYRGLQSLGSLPLLDELSSEKVIHFTVTFEGFQVMPSQPPPYTSIYWYIRLILKDYTELNIISTTTNSIDYNRLLGAYNATKDYISSSLRYLTANLINVFSNCRSIAPPIHSIPPIANPPQPLYLSLPNNSSHSPSQLLLLENGNIEHPELIINSNNNNINNINNNVAFDPSQIHQFATPIYLSPPLNSNTPIQTLSPPQISNNNSNDHSPPNYIYYAIPVTPNANSNSLPSPYPISSS